MKKLSIIIALIALLIASCTKDRGDIIPTPGPGQNPPIENPPPGNPPPNPNPPGNPGNPPVQILKINLKAEMKIGNILYDSIPASLTLRSWDSTGEMTTSFHSMTAGVNQFTLRQGQARFHFRVLKWGIVDEIYVDTRDIKTDSVYVFGATKAAKKLKTELVYMLKNGAYQPESKKEFAYLSNGDLDKITYSLRNASGSPYVSAISQFVYSNQKVERINRYDASNNLKGFTSFSYNSAGKISGMHDKESTEETLASIQYTYGAREDIEIQFTYPGQTYTGAYYIQIENGNIAQSAKSISNHSSDMSTYQYDFNINPYRHMNLPDLYLSNSSKNNVVNRHQTYTNNPGAVPHSYNYTYDSEGYPKEIIITYKQGLYGGLLHTTKTVLTYY